MNQVMLDSFFNELEKIAASNTVTTSQSVPALGSPAPLASGVNVSKSIASASKSPTKPTNYSVVHNQSPMAATGTAAGVKAAPPPPVRA